MGFGTSGFAFEIFGLPAFYDHLFAAFLPNRKFAAVRIVTTVAKRIVSDDVVNEVVFASVG